MTGRARVLRDALIGALLFLFLGAPTPGSVGGCDDSSAFADAVEFCFARESWICARRRARGELTPAEEEACVDTADVMCGGLTWPLDCDPPPSTTQTRACISALRDVGRLSQDDRTFVECDIGALCAAAASGALVAPPEEP